MAIQSFYDQTGVSISVAVPPQRIISLVPSQTELLFYLGLTDRVAGITKFCVHPPQWRSEKIIVGGTKQFDLAAIHRIAPDLIIGNKEENERTAIDALRERYPVWMSDIYSLQDALEMIRSVGQITNTVDATVSLCDKINKGFDALPIQKPRRALYLIWQNPWMASGTDTFINDMMRHAGYENVLPESTRYPTLTDEDIRMLAPDVILLSSEPYPFKPQHESMLRAICPAANIRFVDGEIFSWYGSRLLLAPDYFMRLRASLTEN